MFWVGCLRQEGEDAAAVIVDQHNRQVELVEACSKQPIQIVEERKISDHQHGWFIFIGSGTDADCCRNNTVDAASSTIAQDMHMVLSTPEEAVQVAYGHTIACKEISAIW